MGHHGEGDFAGTLPRPGVAEVGKANVTERPRGVDQGACHVERAVGARTAEGEATPAHLVHQHREPRAPMGTPAQRVVEDRRCIAARFVGEDHPGEARVIHALPLDPRVVLGNDLEPVGHKGIVVKTLGDLCPDPPEEWRLDG